MKQLHRVLALAVLSSLVVVSAAFAQLDSPSLSLGTSGHAKQTIFITAGPSGAPDGFTVQWMAQSTYLANGSHFLPGEVVGGEGVARFFGDPTLNTFGGQVTSFKLDPYETIRVEIGDLYDESGVNGDRSELDQGERYYFTAFANDSKGNPDSNLSVVVSGFTRETFNCTYTLGYWKNHTPWPATSLQLGTVTYTQAQLLGILNQSPQGNGLISLAHQLITAKLNLAQGADPSAVAATIAAADAQIGGLVVPPVGGGSLSPGATSAKTQVLDDFNNGLTGPGHCGAVPTAPVSWGQVKAIYR